MSDSGPNILLGELLPNNSVFHSLMSNAPGSAVIVDTAHRLVYCNDTAKRIFRENGHEVYLGADIRRYFFSENVEQYNLASAKALLGESTTIERTRVINGHTQWLRHKLSPLRNNSNAIVGFSLYSVNIDIEKFTLQQKEVAEYHLGERIKELSLMYKATNILRNEKFSVHEAFSVLVKFLPAGWQYVDFCVARIMFEGVEHCSDNYATPVSVQSAEFTTQDCKHGRIEVGYTTHQAEEYEGPFLKEERALITALAEMIAVHYNERAAHLELRKSEANLKSVFDNTDVGHLLLDRTFKVLSFNKAMLRGYAEATGIILEINKEIDQQVIPGKLDFIHEFVDRLRNDNDAVEYETSYARRGIISHYFVSVLPVKGTNGDLMGYSFSAADITKRKELELERQKIIDDLLQRNRALEQFAFVVSHSIRAPLANILGLSGLLSYELSLEEQKKITSGIVTSAKRLDEVLSDLNDILQVQRTGSERKSFVRLREFTEEVISGLNTDIIRTGMDLELDISVDLELQTIKSSLQTIFVNLISNSIKFAKPGEVPQLKIWAQKDKGCIAINFRDQGIGLDMKKYGDQLFGLYKKFAVNTEGKGVGLYFVKAHTDLLGGKINIESESGAGMHVTLRFPI